MKTHEHAANLALLGLTLAPMVVKVDPNLNVILTACLTVYVGCFRSIKPTVRSEKMSEEHAMFFPLVGSAVLLSLFLVFKFLSKNLVNAVLTCYFFVLGTVALSATLIPAIRRLFPRHWNEDLVVWHIPYFQSASLEFTWSQIISSVPGCLFCMWYASKKHWLANNVLGIAFCIQGIETLSLGSFKTGGILLGGLFVYDVFWVFFTPVMVTVARSFDAPIKLLFPTYNSAKPFSMLGLGDIVIPESVQGGGLSQAISKTFMLPFLCSCFNRLNFLVVTLGIFVALALRFDVTKGEHNRYFNSSYMGYTLGLALTIIVMNWFQAAQPALLYIVPGMIGFLAAHCMWNGEVRQLLEYDELQPKADPSYNASPENEDATVIKKAE